MIFAPVCLVGPSPKEPSQGIHTKPSTWKLQLVWAIQDASGPASLQSHANAKKTIYSWSTHANALHPGFNPSTEFNRWYCKKVVYWLRTPWAVLLEGRCCVSIISVSPGPRLVPGTPGGVLWGFSLQCMERLTEDGKYCAESRQKKMLAGSYVLFGLHAV